MYFSPVINILGRNCVKIERKKKALFNYNPPRHVLKVVTNCYETLHYSFSLFFFLKQKSSFVISTESLGRPIKFQKKKINNNIIRTAKRVRFSS